MQFLSQRSRVVDILCNGCILLLSIGEENTLEIISLNLDKLRQAYWGLTFLRRVVTYSQFREQHWTLTLLSQCMSDEI